MPPRSTVLEKRGWKIKWKVLMSVKYRECDYEGTKTKENQK